MAEIQTSTAHARGDNTSIKGTETEYSALEAGAQKRIQVLDQSIKNYLKQEGSSTGALDAFFGTSDAQLAMANSDHKLIKAMQAERLALTRKLEQAQELNKSGKTQEAKALLGSKHKQDLRQVQAEQRAVGAELDRSLENIETATVITQRVKDGAVIAAATVATVMTAGAGSGALVAIAAGTSAGTIVGGAANSSEAWSHVEHGTKTKEQAILDACTQTQDHALDSFKSSVTSMIGAGVAAKQVAKLAQAGASTAKIAATKALTQGSVSSLSSSSYDTAMSYKQAREDFNTQYATELRTAKPEEIDKLRETFFAERKLDAASITRNLSVATLSGAASAYGGSKIPGPLDKAITSTGVSLARGSAIVAADTAIGTAVGLGSAALKGETLNRDAVIGEVTSNVVSALSGTASAHAKPRNEFAPTAAKPRIDISPTDGPSSATTSTKPGETRPSHSDIKLNKDRYLPGDDSHHQDLAHEIHHSTQAGIDPQHADGKHMSANEYIARRALQELEAKIFKPEDSKTYTPEQLKVNDALIQAHIKLKQDIDTAAKASEQQAPEEATKHYKPVADSAAWLLDAADLKQYQEDYQVNISRKPGEVVRQKNYNQTLAPRDREAIKDVFGNGLSNKDKIEISTNFDRLIETTDNLEILRYKDRIKKDTPQGRKLLEKPTREFYEAAKAFNNVLGLQEPATNIGDLRTQKLQLEKLQEHLVAVTQLQLDKDGKPRATDLQVELIKKPEKTDPKGQVNYHKEYQGLVDLQANLTAEIAKIDKAIKALETEQNTAKKDHEDKKLNNAKNDASEKLAAVIKKLPPGLALDAHNVVSREAPDLTEKIVGSSHTDRSLGKWYEEVFNNENTRDYSNTLSIDGHRGQGDFTAKRVEVLLELKKRNGSVTQYGICPNPSFYDHMGIDAWATITRAGVTEHVPLQIKSSYAGVEKYKGEHTGNAIPLNTAGKELHPELQLELNKALYREPYQPFMIDGAVFNPFSAKHHAKLQSNKDLQKQFLKHFVQEGTEKYKNHLAGIESGEFTNFIFVAH